jgi:hypothetical protein
MILEKCWLRTILNVGSKKLPRAAAVVLVRTVLDAGARAGLPAAATSAAGPLGGERSENPAAHEKGRYGDDGHDNDGVEHVKSPKVSSGSGAGHPLDSDVENQSQV